jgi:hypothetical protein
LLELAVDVEAGCRRQAGCQRLMGRRVLESSSGVTPGLDKPVTKESSSGARGVSLPDEQRAVRSEEAASGSMLLNTWDKSVAVAYTRIACSRPCGCSRAPSQRRVLYVPSSAARSRNSTDVLKKISSAAREGMSPHD